MGLDAGTVCGNRPIGRCIACGLSVCRVHATFTGNRVFCLNCTGNAEEAPPSEEIEDAFAPPQEDPVDGLASSEDLLSDAFEGDEVSLSSEDR
ncbi:MAG: hypothetical protein V2A78_09510 [bacterium]